MIVAVVGPTGVGKTKLSVELAKKYDAVVVNCDAVQVYKELNIGSAKPTEEEKCGIEHLLFDIVSVTDNYTVKDYQKDLRNVLKKYHNRNIVIVGGTGLYLCAGLYDYEFKEEINTNNYDNLSNEQLYNLALEKDKNMDIHKNKRVRLIRFLNKLLYDVKFIGLNLDRNLLYERINLRVDKMMKDGLLDEVKNLNPLRVSSRVLNTAIGYKELYDYFDKKISLEQAIEEIKQNSRHYAKRQFTWFNNKMNVTWFNVNLDDFQKTIDQVEDFLDN